MLVNRAALERHAVPDDGDGLVEPRRAVDDEELGRRKPRSMRSSRTVRQASVLSPPSSDREQHLLAVLAYAKMTRSETKSLCGRAARAPLCRREEPHDRFFGKRAAFHASQSVFTLRQTQLTVSSPTAPPNREARRGAPGVCWAGR